MKTRCQQCQSLCDAKDANCFSCGAPLVVTAGVNESEQWNGKVRSQWRQETASANVKSWRDKLNDWLECDSSQIMLIIIGIATFVVITMLFIYLIAAIGIA